MGVVGCSVGIVLGVVCVALRRVSILVFVVHVASWVCSVHATGCTLCFCLGVVRVLFVGVLCACCWVQSVHLSGC